MLKEFFQRLTGKASAPEMNYAVDAARPDAGWLAYFFPVLNERDEFDESDLLIIWKRARMLHINAPHFSHLVGSAVEFVGSLEPLPATQDEAWNEAALRAWRARVKNAALFDRARRMSFEQALAWMEERAIVDGDCFVIPSRADDGGVSFAFYTAPQVGGGGMYAGVDYDKNGAAVAYYFRQEGGTAQRVPAHTVMQYAHRREASGLRGVSELTPAIRHAQDIREIVGYTKQAVKLAAAFGLVETEQAKGASTGAAAVVAGARKNVIKTPEGPKVLAGSDITITALQPGHDLKVINDPRPSQQVQQFLEYLGKLCSWAMCLEPQGVFEPEKLGSASVRLFTQKTARWQRRRLADKIPLATKMWQLVISGEIAAGRLQPCKDPEWDNVRWVTEQGLTIDVGREANAYAMLIEKGLASRLDYTLATARKTPEAIAREEARFIAARHAAAAEYGISYEELAPPQPGAAVADTTAAEAPAPAADEDPETVTENNEEEK